MQMILKLKDMAIVSSGATFRARVEVSASGNVRVIQMKDLGADNLVYLAQAIQVKYERPKANQLLQAGDLIFRSRGQAHTAALLCEEVADAILAAPLFRVRPNLKKVLPEYLLWWINQNSSQCYFASQAKGTAVQMVSKQSLDNLEVKLPSIDQQHKIVEFFKLSIEEQRLLEKIKEHKVRYAQGVLMQMASKARIGRK